MADIKAGGMTSAGTRPKCDVPGCESRFVRPYPCGLRCEEHKP